MTNNPLKTPGSARAPGPALTWAAALLATGILGFVAWRVAIPAAAGGLAAGLALAFAAHRRGVGAGLARGARAIEALREQLVTVEGQLVRARLEALRGTSDADWQRVADETARREQIEAELAEERRRSEERAREAERALAEERRRTEEHAREAERALAEERRQREAAQQRAVSTQREAERLAAEVKQRGGDQSTALREVERLLSPYIEREKLLLDLARLDGPVRGGLPELLDAIAAKGSFASIVLADEAGLPVAASRGARDAESVAATSSLLFTLSDRMAELGAPPPLAVLVHDQAADTTLHRLFRVEGGRYLLTATGRGRGLVPETLDPALHSIERALLREAWTA